MDGRCFRKADAIYLLNRGADFYSVAFVLNNIKYAILRFGALLLNRGNVKLLCFCQLSSSQFTVASPNTLTVLPAATGVFTLT
jgi:hypothetical protein